MVDTKQMDVNDEMKELKGDVQDLAEAIRMLDEENKNRDLENNDLKNEILMLNLQIDGARKFLVLLDSQECTRESLSEKLSDFVFLRGTIDPEVGRKTNRDKLVEFLEKTINDKDNLRKNITANVDIIKKNKDRLQTKEDRLQTKEDRLQTKEDSWKENKNRIRALSHPGEFDFVVLVGCSFVARYTLTVPVSFLHIIFDLQT